MPLEKPQLWLSLSKYAVVLLHYCRLCTSAFKHLCPTFLHSSRNYTGNGRSRMVKGWGFSLRLHGDSTAASVGEHYQEVRLFAAESVSGGFQPESPKQACLNSVLTLFSVGSCTWHVPGFLLTQVTAWSNTCSPKQHFPFGTSLLEFRNATRVQQHLRTTKLKVPQTQLLITAIISANVNDAKLWKVASWK